MNNRDEAAISCSKLIKTFEHIRSEVCVLRGIDLVLDRQESVAIVGASGSGKTTLLQILASLDRPTSGEVRINGVSLDSLGEEERDHLRNQHIGFIYQFHHLLPEFTAEENVAMPLLIRQNSYRAALVEARKILDRVGLSHRLTHRPNELSGGERQRTAIARAVVGAPSCLLADEPTGNLDQETANDIQELLLELNKERGTQVIIATHDLYLASRVEQAFELNNGVLAPLSLKADSG